jgi:hypothetical protein
VRSAVIAVVGISSCFELSVDKAYILGMVISMVRNLQLVKMM